MNERCDTVDLLAVVLAVLFYFWIEWWGVALAFWIGIIITVITRLPRTNKFRLWFQKMWNIINRS